MRDNETAASNESVSGFLGDFFFLQETSTLPIDGDGNRAATVCANDGNTKDRPQRSRPSSRSRHSVNESIDNRATTPKNASRRAVTPGKQPSRATTPARKALSDESSLTPPFSAKKVRSRGSRRSKDKRDDELFLKLLLDREVFNIEEIHNNYSKACQRSLLVPRRHFLEMIEHGTDATAESRISLGNKSMGDAQASLLSEPISQQVRRGASSIDLSSNRIGGSSIEQFATALGSTPCFLEVLDLSRNTLGISTIPSITQIIDATKLVLLNLNENNLKDSSIEMLAASLESNRTLTWLDLGKNEVSRLGAIALASLVRKNATLLSLGLSWNSVSGEGAVALCSALEDNVSLKTLDLSFNTMGNRSRPIVSKALAKVMRKNQTLTHLDISHNQFGQRECRVLGLALNSNHTLFGLHLEGNAAYTDARGFIRPRSSTFSAMVTGDLRRLHANIMHYPANDLCELDQSGGCWLCGGWQERTISCCAPPDCHGPAKLHISTDGVVEPIALSDFMKTMVLKVAALGKSSISNAELADLGMRMMNDLGIGTMADLDASLRDHDTLFDTEGIFNSWIEKWRAAASRSSINIGRSLLRRIRDELPFHLGPEQHLSGDGTERYPGGPMTQNEEGDWKVSRMLPPGTAFYYFTFQRGESRVAVATKDDLTAARLDALHAGMAAAYSNRLGNTWKSLGNQAATDNGVSNPPLKKSGGPMLLKSRLDKLRGQLNASATSAKAKASIVNRKVR